MAKSVYDQIKKQNGEAFARELRDFDNGIFEIPHIVEMVKYAGYDAAPIKEYLSAFKSKLEGEKIKRNEGQSPFELLKKAGYNAFYVDSLKKQLSIKKYFNRETVLCTFRDEDRFKRYHIIYCIKEGAEKLKPAQNPMREDEYATSVMSIQILKSGGFLKITNRYNHLVDNPDNTFNSNPDRIVPGLCSALENYFKDITIVRDLSIPEGYIFFQNKLLKTNEEILNFFVGENYYIDNGEFVKIDKDKELIIDNYVFNLKTREFKKIINRIPTGQLVYLLKDELSNKALQIKSGKRGYKALFADGVKILETTEGWLTFLNLPHAKELKTDFIKFERFLKYLFVPKVQKIEDDCLVYNRALKHLHLPVVQTIGAKFLMMNEVLESFSAPLLRRMGRFCLHKTSLKSVILPSVEYMEEDCFGEAMSMQKFIAPNLRFSEAGLLWRCSKLKYFYAPKLNKFPKGWFGDCMHFYYLSNQKQLLRNKNNIHKILKTPLAKRIKLYFESWKRGR